MKPKPYRFEYPETRAAINSFLISNSNRQRDILQDDRYRLNKVLSKFGFETPPDTLIKINNYVRAFKNVIRNKLTTDIGEAPEKKKKGQRGKGKINQILQLLAKHLPSKTPPDLSVGASMLGEVQLLRLGQLILVTKNWTLRWQHLGSFGNWASLHHSLLLSQLLCLTAEQEEMSLVSAADTCPLFRLCTVPSEPHV
jgi:hypothetical protein